MSPEVLACPQDEVQDLLKSVVEEVERNHATQVINPTWLQRVGQLPPEASINNTMMGE